MRRCYDRHPIGVWLASSPKIYLFALSHSEAGQLWQLLQEAQAPYTEVFAMVEGKVAQVDQRAQADHDSVADLAAVHHRELLELDHLSYKVHGLQ